jgi:hypothetical protein
LTDDIATFVALADGSFLVERGDELDPTPLAAALELEPPYRAEARRRSGATWAVGARRIRVVESALPASGNEVEIVWDGRERSVRVDGEPTLTVAPALEELGASRPGGWVVRARRLRNSLWEVDLEAL